MRETSFKILSIHTQLYSVWKPHSFTLKCNYGSAQRPADLLKNQHFVAVSGNIDSVHNMGLMTNNDKFQNSSSRSTIVVVSVTQRRDG